ncbi:ribonuclease P protein component [Prochlorococcus marinus]|uniref:Ribonuclease P protein component n=1 Tax=Prochlorococcus marinus XMU1408 TaxID=2213228 RepID=A0A318R0W2_PROMR|nr:ribonuclease P protein component [Prochlorococcus marinus]MBW3042421.1 ribonuclease P protein component [Prochlorococcus marinus str. XMU1408]PYE01153.1 ribonuclease P protein component [Prochlorococcus marinus XMU1408]
MVLPKRMRLKGHRSFDFIYKEGSRFHSSSMVLRVTQANKKLIAKDISSKNKPSIKCAISISNKVSKKSVIRNKLRRVFHQHLSYRLSKMTLDNEVWAFISLKPSCLKNHTSTLLKECDKLLIKAGLTQ